MRYGSAGGQERQRRPARPPSIEPVGHHVRLEYRNFDYE